jgi:hypothetical protein
MTRRIAASTTDTAQVSEADRVRIAAEEKLQAEHRSRTALVIASAARDTQDCRLLLDILGLDNSAVAEALAIAHTPARTKPAARRRRAA